MNREPKNIDEEVDKIMQDLDTSTDTDMDFDEVNDFLNNYNEDLVRALDIDFETVDNIEKDPFDA